MTLEAVYKKWLLLCSWERVLDNRLCLLELSLVELLNTLYSFLVSHCDKFSATSTEIVQRENDKIQVKF